jgi:hypothetical protein
LCHRRIALAAAGAIGLLGAAQSGWAQCSTYDMTSGSGASLIPGTTDIGLHADNEVLAITPPFPLSLYSLPYGTVYVSTNGNLQFGTTGSWPATYTPECLPDPTQITSPTIFAHWYDQTTEDAASGEGIFTATTGTAPNRQFIIEWRTLDQGTGYPPIYDYELVFSENTPSHFDIIYGGLDAFSGAVIGVQNGTGGFFNLYSCVADFPGNGLVLHFDCAAHGPLYNDLQVPVQGPVGASFLATSRVNLATGPASTGVTVLLDGTSINAGTVLMHDDGLNGDVTANDKIYSANVTVGAGTITGVAYTLTAHAQDAQGRTHDANATFGVNPPNDECDGAIPAVLGDNPFDNAWATTSPQPVTCPSCCNDWMQADLWYTFSSPTETNIAVTACTGRLTPIIAVYDTDCTPLACSDNPCINSPWFCAQANHVYKLRIGGVGGTHWVGTFNISAFDRPPVVAGDTYPYCIEPGSTATVLAQVDYGCPPQNLFFVTADASSVGGDASVGLHDDGLVPDEVAGDGIFSGTVATAPATPGRFYELPITATFSGGPVSGTAVLVFNRPAPVAGIAFPSCISPGTSTTVMAQVGDYFCQTALSATVDASSVGGGAAIPLHDDGVAPDFTDSDGTFSGTVTTAAATPFGSYSLPVTVTFDGGPVFVTAQLSVHPPAAYAPPGDCIAEGEGCDPLRWPDTFNGGCNYSPWHFSEAQLCQNYCGTVWNSPARRDLDWWHFFIPAPRNVTITGQSQFSSTSYIFREGCPPDVQWDPLTADCGGDFSITALLPPGQYRFVIFPKYFAGDTVCGINENYWFSINVDPTISGDTVGGMPGTSAVLTGHFAPDCPSTTVTVRGDLTSLGGPANQQFYDDGTHGDAAANDNIFSFTVTVPSGAEGASFNIPLTITDNVARTGTGAATLVVDTVGDLPATATPHDATTPITGNLAVGNDVDMYLIHICDPANFSAAVTSATVLDTVLFLFRADGRGVAMNDDYPRFSYNTSTLIGPVVQSIAPGDYYLAIASFENRPVDATNQALWLDDPLETIRAPDGPGAANPINHWDGAGQYAGAYTITLTGVCALNPCCRLDYNGDGDVGTDQDIEAFFNCLGGGCCAHCPPNADFNCDGDVGTDADIESFFRVLAGGPC